MRNKTFLFPILIVCLFSITFVSWAYTSGLIKLNITTGSSLPEGQSAIITPIAGQAYNVQNGRAQKIAGIQLYKIKLGNPSYSDTVRLYLSVMNMVNDNGVLTLSKDNWWVVASAYYETPVGGTPDLILDDGTSLTKFTSNEASLYLNRTKASGIIEPRSIIPDDGDSSTSDQTIYIVASYQNPGGNIPSGQQSELNNLQFHCMVRM